MAKSYTYLVSFSPAERSDRGTFLIEVTKNIGETHTVEVSSLDELASKVRSLADSLGCTVSAYVRLKDRNGRKPPGFDRRFGSTSQSIYERKTTAPIVPDDVETGSKEHLDALCAFFGL